MRTTRNAKKASASASAAQYRDPAAPKSGERSDQVQSLVRALSILNRLGQSEDGVTLTEISRQVGLSPSTAYRLLATLEHERFVHFNAEGRLWSIGVQAFVTGSAFLKTRSLVAAARPHMRLLMEESEETVNLAVADQHAAIYLAQVECRQMMRAFARPGGRVPLYCSSVGKALLSAMSEAEVAKVIRHQGLARVTARTLSTPEALQDDLNRSRERGYAIDDEEHAVGLRCLAAVVFNENRSPIAAISISGPMARISDERIPLLGSRVRKRADAITAQFGGVLPHWRLVHATP